MAIEIRIDELPPGAPLATDILPFVALLADDTQKATFAQAVAAGGAVMNVTGIGPIGSTGGQTPAISIAAAVGGGAPAAGSMSGADKVKLDTISANAAVASVGGTAPIGSSGGATPVISIAAAVGGGAPAAGSMSGADKVKLDGLQVQGASVAIAALDIDWSLGSTFYKNLAGGGNVFTFSNVIEGGVIIVQLLGAGTSTVTWPAGTKFPGGVAPVQTVGGLDRYTVSKINGIVGVVSGGQAFA